MDRPILGTCLTAIAAISLACCSSRPLTSTPCDGQPHNHVIDVGKTVSCKEAYLSKSANHHVTWQAAKGGTLKIDFGADNPFPKLSCQPANVCTSGPIAHDAAPKTYQYKVWLDGTEVDPSIIIQP